MITDAHLTAELIVLANELHRANNEIERLKALILRAEAAGYECDVRVCPWCHSEAYVEGRNHRYLIAHLTTCHAFSAPGVVR